MWHPPRGHPWFRKLSETLFFVIPKSPFYFVITEVLNSIIVENLSNCPSHRFFFLLLTQGYVYQWETETGRERETETERDTEREKGRETLAWERNIDQWPSVSAPDQGSNSQPIHVSWPGIKPAAFWCTVWCSNQLSYPARVQRLLII